MQTPAFLVRTVLDIMFLPTRESSETYFVLSNAPDISHMLIFTHF